MAHNKGEKIIFLGNGLLADYALAVLEEECQILFHARTATDLEKVCELKCRHPEAHGVLASYGIIIKQTVLDLFEPEGILNIHPSMLPKYRGPSPIESAILDGDDEFGVSIMKLAPAMDAGPIYYQTVLSELPLDKSFIYKKLAETGAEWIVQNINNLPEVVPQDDSQATFTKKLTKSMGILHPETDTAEKTIRKIIAYQGFPKPKYAFLGLNCIVLRAHILEPGEKAVLPLPCADGQVLSIDRLQPEGRKAMEAKAFINGYKK